MDVADVVVANRYVVHGGTAAPLVPLVVAVRPPMPRDDLFDVVVTYGVVVHGGTVLVIPAPVARTKAGFWADQTHIVLDFRGIGLANYSWATAAPLRPTPVPQPQSHKKKNSAVIGAVRTIAGM